MPLHLIGLGLNDEQDITLRGLNALKKCSEVYLEAYTSILTVSKERLEQAFGVSIQVADREFVESGIEPLLQRAATADIALLVVGDPFGATTHCDLIARAKQLGVPMNVVHNASIMNAIGAVGLQLYRYGETVSIPFFTSTWRPASFFDKLVANLRQGLHTLALVDIKVKEPTLTSLARGKRDYLPARFMTIRQAVQQILSLAAERKGSSSGSDSATADGPGLVGPATRAIGVARIGCATQLCVHGTLDELQRVDFGAPLHSLVIVGEACGVEEDLVSAFCTRASETDQLDEATLAKVDHESERIAAAHEGQRIEVEEEDDGEVGVPDEGDSLFSAPRSRASPSAAVAAADGGNASLDDVMGIFGMDG
mmetsp:Transcript_6296/g.13750  ORF Transcript_6296/g.13750 Transcript_6296/m.13750 type:complete len:368 (-) Transcript_6296:82-1185(-)